MSYALCNGNCTETIQPSSTKLEGPPMPTEAAAGRILPLSTPFAPAEQQRVRESASYQLTPVKYFPL